MTLTTYRSPFIRVLHMALELAASMRGALHLGKSDVPRARALTVCADAVLRDAGVVPADAWSFGAQPRHPERQAFLRTHISLDI